MKPACSEPLPNLCSGMHVCIHNKLMRLQYEPLMPQMMIDDEPSFEFALVVCATNLQGCPSAAAWREGISGGSAGPRGPIKEGGDYGGFRSGNRGAEWPPPPGPRAAAHRDSTGGSDHMCVRTLLT